MQKHTVDKQMKKRSESNHTITDNHELTKKDRKKKGKKEERKKERKKQSKGTTNS